MRASDKWRRRRRTDVSWTAFILWSIAIGIAAAIVGALATRLI